MQILLMVLLPLSTMAIRREAKVASRANALEQLFEAARTEVRSHDDAAEALFSTVSSLVTVNLSEEIARELDGR